MRGIQGREKLQLTIGALKVQHGMWVADITDDCILGADFLEPYGCLVVFRDNKLLIGSEEIPFVKWCSQSEPSCCRVLLKECVDVPPRSETVVTARIEGSLGVAKWGLLEPGTVSSRAADGVLIGRTLVNLENEDIPLRLMNLSDLPHRIKKGTELAVCEPVCGVSTSDNYRESAGCAMRPQVETEIPNHLRELHERSIIGLDESQKEMLHNLLCEFSNLFSQGSHDLGRTDLVKTPHLYWPSSPCKAATPTIPTSKEGGS